MARRFINRFDDGGYADLEMMQEQGQYGDPSMQGQGQYDEQAMLEQGQYDDQAMQEQGLNGEQAMQGQDLADLLLQWFDSLGKEEKVQIISFYIAAQQEAMLQQGGGGQQMQGLQPMGEAAYSNGGLLRGRFYSRRPSDRYEGMKLSRADKAYDMSQNKFYKGY